MRNARAAAASPDVRFWLNLCGTCASQVCVRVCVSGCANVCVARSRFAVIDTTAPRTALTSAQGSRLSSLRKMQKRQKQNETQRYKNQIEFSLDREWATPDALLKTINRFDIERAAGRLKDTKIHRIALHCIAEQSRTEQSSAQLNATWPSNWNTAG